MELSRKTTFDRRNFSPNLLTVDFLLLLLLLLLQLHALL